MLSRRHKVLPDCKSKSRHLVKGGWGCNDWRRQREGRVILKARALGEIDI